jgi:hypothetical protein
VGKLASIGRRAAASHEDVRVDYLRKFSNSHGKVAQPSSDGDYAGGSPKQMTNHTGYSLSRFIRVLRYASPDSS